MTTMHANYLQPKVTPITLPESTVGTCWWRHFVQKFSFILSSLTSYLLITILLRSSTGRTFHPHPNLSFSRLRSNFYINTIPTLVFSLPLTNQIKNQSKSQLSNHQLWRLWFFLEHSSSTKVDTVMIYMQVMNWIEWRIEWRISHPLLSSRLSCLL